MYRIILIVVVSFALCFAGYQWHKSKQENKSFVQDIKSRTDQYGFLDISVNLTGSNVIVIMAPVNSSSQHAKIADYLAKELNNQNIPATRINGYSFNQDLNNMTDIEINQRVQYVRTMAPPLVFVNGKIKSNPSIEDIKKEWGLQ